jgi:hypothetical protein
MRKIKDLSTAIEAKNVEIQKLRDDADRCRHAAAAGSRSMELLEQLRARKAEIQAIAFVEKTTAQTEDIDAEILGLEQGTAETLAQARAARLALVMIEGEPSDAHWQASVPTQVARTFTPPQATVSRMGLQTNLVTHPGLVNKLLDAESVEEALEPEPEPQEPKSKLGAALKELAALEEQRRELALTWLADRREKAIDRYIKTLTELGPIVAEISATDRARGKLGDHKNMFGHGLVKAFRSADVPIPFSRKIQMPAGYFTPIAWLRDIHYGDNELEQVYAELQEVGVLP